LNTDLEINNEIQYCEIGTVCGGVLVGKWTKEVKVREHVWWTSYTYTKQNSKTSCSCLKWDGEGIKVKRWWES
jgi:hypothetical protein